MAETPNTPQGNITLPSDAQNKIECDKQFYRIESQTKLDLRTNPRYKNFFEKYSAQSVERFIDYYAREKASCLCFGDMYVEEEDNLRQRFIDIAKERLWDIQQKKLFNLQCQWRAEQVELPGIELSMDFGFADDKIELCPFIPPITEQELEMYKQFLVDADDPLSEYILGWQHYDWWKHEMQKDSENDSYPEWYHFYDVRFGTQGLINLPDIRGDKEHFYYHLAIKDELERRQKTLPSLLPHDPRPELRPYDQKTIDTFVHLFEPPHIVKYYTADNKIFSKTRRYLGEDLADALQVIYNYKARVPVEAYHDWREGLYFAWQDFERQQIIASLDKVYQEYCHEYQQKQNITGLQNYLKTMESRQYEMRLILRGRVLNGEPEDLSF